MPPMQLKMKKSEDEMKRLLFDPNLKKASSIRGLGIVNENATIEWTEVAELRLFSKVITFKPAGVNRHFNLGQLANYMNNIYEDEEDADFEVFLTPEDFKLYQRRREIANKPDIVIFKPAYKIRPTPEMIMEKLRQFYDMDVVENNEYLPEIFTAKSEFSPNVGVVERTASAEVIESDRATPIARRLMEESARSSSPSLAALKRKSLAVVGRSRSNSPSSTAAARKH